jgi:NADH-quinone oxidoreductase subunit N
MTIPPVFFELFVLALGILLLLLETFSEKQDRKVFALIAIIGLAIVFLFLQGSVPGSSGMASYVVDSVAIFFKKIVVVTTIVVLIMSIDYADTIKRFLPGASAQSGLGEFFALPVLTCAGMMWMSSAIDFILIFVSLELVTISFYILVAYMRRNANSLEAGVKYLILSALSTGFTIYGITWIYGVTHQTNLTQIE